MSNRIRGGRGWTSRSAVVNTVMPHFSLMHEMTTDHVHEEIQLLANDVSTMLFETLADVPRWRDYYRAHDQTPHYQYLAIQLKAMQFLRGGRRWLLKSPQHLEQVPVLDRVFPGSIVVFTHRDPVPVALSMVAMITYSARMHRRPVPVEQIAHSWIDRLEQMLNALVRDRDTIGPDRSIDIRFDDFMADEIGVAEKVYDLAGEPFTEPARNAVADYLSWPPARPAGKRRNVLRDVRAAAKTICGHASRRTSSDSSTPKHKQRRYFPACRVRSYRPVIGRRESLQR